MKSLDAPSLRLYGRLKTKGAHVLCAGGCLTAMLTWSASAAFITIADLAGYRAIERTPLRGGYRGYEILTMPPPSSGGIALLQMLGMLEPHDVAALGINSAAKIHGGFRFRVRDFERHATRRRSCVCPQVHASSGRSGGSA
jgi:gamma-glutamyltranspeptidase